MYILGISAFYDDSAAAIIKDGYILAAAQEERFTRIKHDQTFPINAIRYCFPNIMNHTPHQLFILLHLITQLILQWMALVNGLQLLMALVMKMKLRF